jgi:SAM-dependent methyltransferase
MLENALWLMKRGPRYVMGRVHAKVFAPKVRCWPLVEEAVRGKVGIEVGGPSSMFSPRKPLPIYPIVASLDGCNFGADTVWEGRISEGTTFQYGSRRGRQYIAEAWQIPVADGSYDFVASCHMLEHSANPIRCLNDWRRILKPGGSLVLVLPDGACTFDHLRAVTTIDHVTEDFRRGMGEDDLTHLDESVRLHDLAMSPEYRSREDLAAHFKDNLRSRRIHHHVFDEALAVALVGHSGFRVLAHERLAPNSIVVIAQRP